MYQVIMDKGKIEKVWKNPKKNQQNEYEKKTTWGITVIKRNTFKTESEHEVQESEQESDSDFCDDVSSGYFVGKDNYKYRKEARTNLTQSCVDNLDIPFWVQNMLQNEQRIIM